MSNIFLEATLELLGHLTITTGMAYTLPTNSRVSASGLSCFSFVLGTRFKRDISLTGENEILAGILASWCNHQCFSRWYVYRICWTDVLPEDFAVSGGKVMLRVRFGKF